MPVQQVTPVTCPNCRTRFNSPVEPIINGQDPALKGAFLQGYLNVIRCPQCGFTGMASNPVLYYDLEKELAFVLVPGESGLLGEAQEKIIGDLTNKLINSLPNEQRKFYLFNPKTFLTLESMVKAILEADGITEEMLQAQEARMKLVEAFLNTKSEEELKLKVKENDSLLDREFFETLTAYMQNAQLSGDQAQAQTFLGLRTLVSRWSTNGRELVAEIDRELGIVVMKSQEELLDKLQQARSEEEFQSLVVAGQSFLDYGFFQQLTAKIDEATKQGNQAEANRLRALRTRILDTKSQLEAENKAALEAAGKLLEQLLQSRQPDKILDENLDKLDDAFFFILQANMREAQRQGYQDAARALEMIGAIALSKLQEQNDEPASDQPSADEPEQAAEAKPNKPTIHIAKR
jgi:hypothetical protein